MTEPASSGPEVVESRRLLRLVGFICRIVHMHFFIFFSLDGVIYGPVLKCHIYKPVLALERPRAITGSRIMSRFIASKFTCLEIRNRVVTVSLRFVHLVTA